MSDRSMLGICMPPLIERVEKPQSWSLCQLRVDRDVTVAREILRERSIDHEVSDVFHSAQPSPMVRNRD
jgi:hypothetical protein